MLTKLISFTTHTLHATLVHVEADTSQMGQTKTNIVGLPDAAVKEAADRVRSAIRNSNFRYPRGRITCNLAPASLKKQGSAFDLPIAIAILASNCEVLEPSDIPKTAAFLGELSLDGTIHGVHGILSAAIAACDHDITDLFVPAANLHEAALISDEKIKIFGVNNLRDLVQHLTGKKQIPAAEKVNLDKIITQKSKNDTCMSHVRGQQHAKRALEIAAAGAHNILMNGPPGSGKTMLARAIPTILPPLTRTEIIEVTQIHSIAGTLSSDLPIILERPFRAPHHTASAVSLIGGSGIPRPGEISLAHRGVLFLDEFPEFPTAVLETLRQPLEDGFVTVSRISGTAEFPARFILVAAQNPCPCGFLGDSEKECTCSASTVQRYRSKISGPLLDRIDLHISVPRVPIEKLQKLEISETSETIRDRITRARQIQVKRGKLNNELNTEEIKTFCALPTDANDLLLQAVDKLNLSTRAYTRILRVARTIADLAASADITREHIAEALGFREK